MYEYQARLIRVVDADTLRMEIDLGMDIKVNATVRLAGVNAPEASTVEGVAATIFTSTWLASDSGIFRISTVKDRREKYGRYLAFVYNGDACLNDDLLSGGHAVRYSGKG